MLIDKFAYHLPLYRQHQRLTDAGITVSRAWLTQIVHQGASLLEPIYDAQFASVRGSRIKEAGRHHRQLLAEWSRPICADERPVPARFPTFRIDLPLGHTAVTLNRSQRSSTCRALSFSARSLRSPLRSNMA